MTVPATSANLGPGYDSLGMALSLHDVLRVRTSGDGLTSVVVHGEGENELPRDASHLCVQVMAQFLDAAGYETPVLQLTAENRIPHGRGLGSSAAAVVSAAVAANALLPEEARLDGEALLKFCAGVEGHPDNVAPAIFGGLTVSWRDGASFATTKAPIHSTISAVVAIPSDRLSTASARGLLPDVVPHAAAADNAGRAALLVHALATTPDLLMPATEDSLHQDYREPAMPESLGLLYRLRSDGFAAVISGAGPTVAAFVRDDAEAEQAENAINAAVAAITAKSSAATKSAVSWRVLRLKVDKEGARVGEHRG